jgi:hypothetical protein
LKGRGFQPRPKSRKINLGFSRRQGDPFQNAQYRRTHVVLEMPKKDVLMQDYDKPSGNGVSAVGPSLPY